MTIFIIIIGVILAALLIGVAAWAGKTDKSAAADWVMRNWIDKDIL